MCSRQKKWLWQQNRFPPPETYTQAVMHEPQTHTKRPTRGWIGRHFTSIQGKLPHCSCKVLTCLLPLAQTGPCYSLQPAEGWLFHRSESPSYPADHTAQIEWWMAVRTPVKRKGKRGRKYIKEWGGWNLKLRLFWGWGINNNKWVVF